MRITFPYLVTGAVVAVLLAVVGYFVLRDKPENTETAPQTAQATREVPPPAEPAASDEDTTPMDTVAEPEAPAPEPSRVEIPPPADLADSDSAVQSALKLLAPDLSQWFIPDEQIRKWVLTVDLVADGKLPKRYRPIDYPMDKFAVEKQGDTLVAADANYDRLTPLLDKVTAIDTALLAEYYVDWEPLLEKAWREQGKPGTFRDRLLTALSQILAVNPREEKAALERPSVFYRYKDNDLEDASDIEKLGWRMGEDNLLNLQAFARDLRQQIQPL